MDAYREEESWLPLIAYIEKTRDRDVYMYIEREREDSDCHSLSLCIERERERDGCREKTVKKAIA